MPEEDGRIITSYGYGVEAGVQTNEIDTYTEGRLTDRLAFVAKTYSKSSPIDDAELVELALKRSVFRSHRLAVSVQGGPTWTDQPQAGCARTGGEARLLAGASFAGGNAFGNVELGARGAQGGCRHFRLEATGGFRPVSDWLILAQSFTDRDFAHDTVLKAQLSGVRFTSSGRGLQFGVRAQLEGGEFIAPTLIVGYWSVPR